ncbi:hypothetical protein GCM10025857_27950 [Alicyclobacillus contaminans]|nr:hypothetical protein GCM10025857_27950 [Alicyclobacillus contaminans]
MNYAKATQLLYNEEGKLIGVEVRDQVHGRSYRLHARKVVNATGPWVDQLREMDRSKTGKTLHLTKGVHIVVDRQRFALHNAVYFDVPDGRMVFAIPRGRKVYVGTTDTNYDGDLVHPRMTTDDLNYLVQAVNFMFPSVQLSPQDVESSWAGVRPLIHEEGKGPSEISRKDEIFHSPSGLLTIAGGKLTGYRKMAEKVVNQVAQEISAVTGRTFPPCTTDRVPISGGHTGGSAGFAEYFPRAVAEGVRLGLSDDEARTWVQRYGSNVDVVFDILRNRSNEAAAVQLPPNVFAPLAYSVEYEMAVTAEDFFTRRTGSTWFDIAWVRQWKDPVIHAMAHMLHWDDETRETQRVQMETRLTEATTPAEAD